MEIKGTQKGGEDKSNKKKEKEREDFMINFPPFGAGGLDSLLWKEKAAWPFVIGFKPILTSIPHKNFSFFFESTPFAFFFFFFFLILNLKHLQMKKPQTSILNQSNTNLGKLR